MNTKIFSVFPACGKTYLYEHQDEYGLKILDLDSSEFSWIIQVKRDNEGNYIRGVERVRNPDFPNNYIKNIKENIGKYDYIFVSSHKEVRDALDIAGIDFTIVYPDHECLVEWVRRCYKRQIKGKNGLPIEVLINNWNRWITQCRECGFEHDEIILKPDEYLSDVIKPPASVNHSKIVYGETSYDDLFDIVDSLDEELENALEKIKELEAENEKLKDIVKNNTSCCDSCKGYDEKSPNYGYTRYCEDCFWYPWADVEKCPKKWELKE